MNLESDKRLNIQLRLDFSSAPTGEAARLPPIPIIGTFRTCRDFRVESAFGGKAEVGFRARQGQLLAQSGRLARSEMICVVWSGLPGHWIDSLDSGIGHSIPSFSEIIRGIAMQ